MVVKAFVLFMFVLIGGIQYSDIENMSSADKKAVIVFDLFILSAFIGTMYWHAIYRIFARGIPASVSHSLSVRYLALRSIFMKFPSWMFSVFATLAAFVIFAHWGVSMESCETLLASEPRIWSDSQYGTDALRRMVCESRPLVPDTFWQYYSFLDAYYVWFLGITVFIFAAIGFDAVLSFLAKWGILNRLSSVTGRKPIDPHFSFFV